ncbi:sideroflexin-1 [Halyomorpha halys]|uniref:sideroflexin-1 n=1 Tax=Halyomorpha halys TaxID=286706 RepID=UPI0006D4E827|nr:sideroflexin-3 [Halyomorpha halys]XP_014272452.1 sideroflexin-3 [Halyomorpha halys]
MGDLSKIDINKPRWDQSTYIGRAKYYFTITNPLNLFTTSKTLENARTIVEKHRNKEKLDITEDELWKAKHLYDSAFHPITGEKQALVGRMSCQVPGNMAINGGMITYHQSTSAVVFWQWINQSFNAIVNYTNRSDATMTVTQIGVAYVCATTGAIVTALYLKKRLQRAHPIIRRYVPFFAVAAANCINIPIMRNQELREGIRIFNEKDKDIGTSKIAARSATAQVVFSRIIMAIPSLMLTPIILQEMSKRCLLTKPWAEPVVATGLCGLILTFATPLACALFIQRVPVKASHLEPHIQEKVGKDGIVFYNKGL